MLNFPYRREARHTMVARVAVDADGVVSAGFVPCWIDEEARPVAHGEDEQGRETAEYVEAMTREAGLDTRCAGAMGRSFLRSALRTDSTKK